MDEKQKTKSNRLWLILGGILAVIVLAGIGIKMFGSTPNEGKAETLSSDLLSQAANSYKNWQMLDGQAEVTWTRLDQNQKYQIEFSFDLPETAEVITTDLSGNNNGGLWSLDKDQQITQANDLGEVQSEELPPYLRQYLETGAIPEVQNAPDAIIMHPFAMAIPSPIGEYLFPIWLTDKIPAEKAEIFGEEELLGRKVKVLNAELENGEAYKLWIDTESGLLLKVFHQVNPDFSMEMNMLSLKLGENTTKN